MHNLVKSYLVHYAYVETLQDYEDEEMELEDQSDEKDKDGQDNMDIKETEIEKAARVAASKGLNG